MKLLLTNDDGINAKGLYALAKELEKEHDITVVAPDNQRSACGHSITLTRELLLKEVKLKKIKGKCYSLDGTPADCVRLAIDRLVGGKVDMVISGINNGLNAGIDVLYSGTVSAAIEASICKVPSMAFSTEFTDKLSDYEQVAKYALKTLNLAAKNYLKDDIVLNVNIPLLGKEKIKGIKVCEIGDKTFENYFTPDYLDETEQSFQVKGNESENLKPGSDQYFVKAGYISITPLHYDLTNYKIIEEVRNSLGDGSLLFD